MLIFSISVNSCFADQAVDIKQDEKAPFSGVLLDKEKANKIKDQLLERDEFEKLNKSLNTTIIYYKNNENILQEQNTLLLNKNFDLSKNLNESRETSGTVKFLYFLGGVIVTGAAVYGASKLVK